MRTVLLTALLIATAVSAPAVAPAADELGGGLPGVSATPVALPKLDAPVPLPVVPDVPLPKLDTPVPLPDVPAVPLPVPKVDMPLPVPVTTPAPGGRPVPVSERRAPQPASTPAASSRGPAAAAPRASRRASSGPGAGPAPSARRRARRAAGGTGQGRRRSTRPVAGTVTRGGGVSAPGDREVTTAAPAARPQPRERASTAQRLVDDVGELVAVLPAALLWSLIGIAVIALGMAGNAYWQSRRRVALEVQRAELLEDVGLLSSALLPAMPDATERLVVSAAYRPADGPAAGGDFYDVFALGGDRVGVLLGDVSGHGRESLTHAALARYTLRTLLAAGHGPAETLARADRLLARDLAPHFVTVIAGIYDERRSELTYAKAGHAPPIVLGMPHDPDDEQPACPLGLGLGEAWPEFSLELADDTSVCLYTDGLEDARLQGVRLGREQVTRLLAAQASPDATQLIADIRAYADRMSDDTAAVVLRRR